MSQVFKVERGNRIVQLMVPMTAALALAGGGGGGGEGSVHPDDLPFVTVEDYGAVGDFVTDDKAAFEAAEAAAADSGRYVALKARKYYVSSFNAHKPVFWLGAGGNAVLAGDGGTIIRSGKNANGWVANKNNTHGDGLGTQGDSSGGKVQGVAFYGGNITVDGAGAITSFAAGDSPTGHGVRIRSTFYELEDVLCAFFGGDGFNIDCNSGGSDYQSGNANNFRLIRCQSIYNGRYGLLVNGVDANAGQIDTFSAISCGGGGIVDFSFLGNTYNAFHIRDCGMDDPTGNDGPVGVCLYGGNRYVAAADQLVAASTTVPGTNSAVWIPAPFATGAARAWVTGQSWIVGSPFATNPANVNARNVLLGCYCESAQAPIQATYPTLIVGGLLEEVGFTPGSSAGRIIGTRGGIQSGALIAYREASGANVVIGEADGLSPSTNILRHFTSGNTDYFAITKGGDDLYNVIINDGIVAQFTPAGMTGAVSSPNNIVTLTGTAHTAALTHVQKYLRFTNAGATTFTIPLNATVAFPIGTEISGIMAGGALTIAPETGGVTLNAADGDLTLATQFASFTVKKIDTDAWDVIGKFE